MVRLIVCAGCVAGWLLYPAEATANRSAIQDTATCPARSFNQMNANRGLLRDLGVSSGVDDSGAQGDTKRGDQAAKLPEPIVAVQAPNPPDQAGSPPNADNPDYYRLEIEYKSCDRIDDRDYNREGRGWPKRLFLHKVADKVLTVKASITPLGVSATKTLASIIRNSGSKGETWTTDVENNSIILPYFRADGDAVGTLDISFDSSRHYEGAGIAGTSLDIISRAAALISPASSLITKANKDRFNDAATFVDSTIAGLLRVDIDENVHLDLPLDDNKTLAVITLFAPGADDPYSSVGWPDRPVGQWTIRVKSLKGSIFQNAATSKLSAASIMNFHVSKEKTLKAALTESNNVQLARDALLKGTGDGSDLALSLCRATAIEADQQGFSQDDVGRAVWAYLTDLALPQTKRDAETACAQLDHWPSADETGKAKIDNPKRDGAPKKVASKKVAPKKVAPKKKAA